MLSNNDGFTMRSRKKIQSFWKEMKMNTKLKRHSKGSLEREVHSDTGLPRKDRNISNKKPNPTSTRTGGTTTNKVQSE